VTLLVRRKEWKDDTAEWHAQETLVRVQREIMRLGGAAAA
jgi:hypothetical protein